jgi:hypothetical protein
VLFAYNRVPPRRPQRPLRLIPNTGQEETAEDAEGAEDCLLTTHHYSVQLRSQRIYSSSPDFFDRGPDHLFDSLNVRSAALSQIRLAAAASAQYRACLRQKLTHILRQRT